MHLQNTTTGRQCTCRIQLGEGSAPAEYNYRKAVHLQNTTRGRQCTCRIQLQEGSAPAEYAFRLSASVSLPPSLPPSLPCLRQFVDAFLPLLQIVCIPFLNSFPLVITLFALLIAYLNSYLLPFELLDFLIIPLLFILPFLFFSNC